MSVSLCFYDQKILRIYILNLQRKDFDLSP